MKQIMELKDLKPGMVTTIGKPATLVRPCTQAEGQNKWGTLWWVKLPEREDELTYCIDPVWDNATTYGFKTP